MRGRDGDYAPDVGVHVTRVLSCDEYTSWAWRSQCLALGVQPDELRPSDGGVVDGQRDEVGRVAVLGQWWPVALATCTCRLTRPAVSRIMARSSSFVHRQLRELT